MFHGVYVGLSCLYACISRFYVTHFKVLLLGIIKVLLLMMMMMGNVSISSICRVHFDIAIFLSLFSISKISIYTTDRPMHTEISLRKI